MKVVMRADAGPIIGTGHLMRCAALAQRLIRRGAKVHLIGDIGSASLVSRLTEQGIRVHQIRFGGADEDTECTRTLLVSLAPVDLLIVDHYELGFAWETALRPVVGRLGVFDDLGREHDCSVLIDQNLHRDPDKRYENRVPANCRVFVGPRYAILDPQFERPSLRRVRDGSVGRISVFFGGTDLGEQIGKAIDAFRMIPRQGLAVSIICGPANPLCDVWQEKAKDMPELRVLRQVTAMAEHLHETDLALGCCGVSAWERCLLGVPSLVSIVADNQSEDALLLDELGAVRNLGWGADLRAQDWADAISALRAEPAQVASMAEAARRVMDGWPEACDCVIQALLG